MAPDTGRHDADENATDRARLDYLAGESGVELDQPDRAELDELRALLADPSLWSEPPASLEDSVVALIASEAGATVESSTTTTALDRTTAGEGTEPHPFPRPTRSAERPTSTPAHAAGESAAPIDLSAARQRRERREGRRRFTRPLFLIATAAAVAAVTFTAVFLVRDSNSQRQFNVALSATELAPGASGSAVMLRTDSGWEIHLDATGLPRRENGDFYQAWLRNTEGVLVPIGTFNEGTNVILWAGISPEKFSTMTITLESADGNQDSSGQRVLVGTAVEQ